MDRSNLFAFITKWRKNITSGEYEKYYESMYADR